MNLKKNDLIGLPVYTQSNQHLGKVSDFELETSSQLVVKYYIKSKDIIKELLEKELIINNKQVMFISKQKMVVEDNVVPEKEVKKTALRKAVPVS